MKYTKSTLRFAAIALSSIGLAGTTMAADSGISTTGPDSTNQVIRTSSTDYRQNNSNAVGVTNANNQSAMSGSVSSNGNTGGGYGGSMYGGGWANYNPSTWQQNGHSYNDWWSGLMGSMGQTSGGWGTSDSWMPEGANWQDNWSNWDPQMWQSHGSSWNNWYNHMMPYLNDHQSMMRNNWGMGGSGQAGTSASGSATNNNQTTTAVSATNAGGGQGMVMSGSGMGGGTIYLTGPGSRNTIYETTDTRYISNNRNDVNVGNQNSQGATSGDVSSSRNTTSGSGMSGDASNSNATVTHVVASN